MGNQFGLYMLMNATKKDFARNHAACETLQARSYYRKYNSSVMIQRYDDGPVFIDSYYFRYIPKLPVFVPEEEGCSRCLKPYQN